MGEGSRAPITGHGAVAESLAAWFTENARDLPWRKVDGLSGMRDPYRSLVSELMLQQTQVSRVLEKFKPFIDRFPTVEALAAADEQDVLAAWSGLGYYRRARLLHAAAKQIVAEHEASVPEDEKTLQSITGIGRYTAGAITSIVFDRPAPIVDGNVSRVLMRLRADERQPTDKAAVRENWEDAAGLAERARSPALTNEGLMELGALVCTPKAPRCDACPLRERCRAADLGMQDRIPAPKAAPKRTVVYHTAVVVRDASGRLLIERRPERGLWASMWQAPTAESEKATPRPSTVLKRLGIPGRAVRVDRFVHITSHREVRFSVYAAPGPSTGLTGDHGNDAALIAPSELDDYPVANPHRKILLGTG